MEEVKSNSEGLGACKDKPIICSNNVQEKLMQKTNLKSDVTVSDKPIRAKTPKKRIRKSRANTSALSPEKSSPEDGSSPPVERNTSNKLTVESNFAENSSSSHKTVHCSDISTSKNADVISVEKPSVSQSANVPEQGVAGVYKKKRQRKKLADKRQSGTAGAETKVSDEKAEVLSTSNAGEDQGNVLANSDHVDSTAVETNAIHHDSHSELQSVSTKKRQRKRRSKAPKGAVSSSCERSPCASQLLASPAAQTESDSRSAAGQRHLSEKMQSIQIDPLISCPGVETHKRGGSGSGGGETPVVCERASSPRAAPSAAEAAAVSHGIETLQLSPGEQQVDACSDDNCPSSEGDEEYAQSAAVAGVSAQSGIDSSTPSVEEALRQRLVLAWCVTSRRVSWHQVATAPPAHLPLLRKQWKPPAAAAALASNELRQLLADNGIVLSTEKGTEGPVLSYACCFCDEAIADMSRVLRHVQLSFHLANSLYMRHQALWRLPCPSERHTSSLSSLITCLYASRGLTDQKRSDHEKLFNDTSDFIIAGLRHKLPDNEFSVNVIGSWCHGCGLDSQPVDLSLKKLDKSGQNSDDTYDVNLLLIVLENLEASTDHSGVKLLSGANPPALHWLHTESGLRFSLTISTASRQQLTRLVADYTLLDWRVAPLAAAFRHLTNVFGVDCAERGYLTGACYLVCVLHFLQQTQPPVLPVLHQMVSDHSSCDYMPGAEAARLWSTENASPLGTLWLQLLRFFLDTALNTQPYVVSIRQHAQLDFNWRRWGNRQLGVEDPFPPMPSMIASLSCLTALNYIAECLLTAYCYFATPLADAKAPLSLHMSAAPAHSDQTDHLKRCTMAPPGDELVQLWSAREQRAADQPHCYVIEAKILGCSSVAPQFCSACFKTNHSESACPSMRLPSPEPLPALTEQHEQLLSQLCHLIYEEGRPSPAVVTARDKLLLQLQSWLRADFPSAQLQLFGSSTNGFGTASADLDVCMTLAGVDTVENVDVLAVLERVARCLRQLRQLSDVLFIRGARVPIVKLSVRQQQQLEQLEVDISMYNTLALANTRLLRTYAAVDSRVRILGYTMKYLAKQCGISGRATGGLSSYSFVVLVIYFLQRCQPPLVPVLQQLSADRQQPAPPGRQLHFFHFSEREQLAAAWPQLGANTTSPGLLWLQLLRFYTEHFQFNRHVVCIGQLEPLTKSAKLWNTDRLAIEDPFLLSHNLAGGVSKKMYVYIRRCFLKWRSLHGTPSPSLVPLSGSSVRFLLDTERLSDSDRPHRAPFSCHGCRARDHGIKDCPRVSQNAHRPGRDQRTPRDQRHPGSHPNQNHLYRQQQQHAFHLQQKRTHPYPYQGHQLWQPQLSRGQHAHGHAHHASRGSRPPAARHTLMFYNSRQRPLPATPAGPPPMMPAGSNLCAVPRTLRASSVRAQYHQPQ